jgi:hypothetical protein
MKKILVIMAIIVVLIPFLTMDQIQKSRVKTQYFVLKAEYLEDYDSLITFLLRYDGEAQTKVKFLTVGLWVKRTPALFEKLQKAMNNQQCIIILDTINIQLLDVGKNKISGCTELD